MTGQDLLDSLNKFSPEDLKLNVKYILDDTQRIENIFCVKLSKGASWDHLNLEEDTNYILLF